MGLGALEEGLKGLGVDAVQDLEMLTDEDLANELGLDRQAIAWLRGKEYVQSLGEFLQEMQLEGLEEALGTMGVEAVKDLELLTDEDLASELGFDKKTIAALRGKEYIPTLAEYLAARHLETLEEALREVGVEEVEDLDLIGDQDLIEECNLTQEVVDTLRGEGDEISNDDLLASFPELEEPDDIDNDELLAQFPETEEDEINNEDLFAKRWKCQVEAASFLDQEFAAAVRASRINVLQK